MKVVWAEAAENDLLEIGAYIKEANPSRAVSFIDEIIQAGEGIADMPRAFALVPRLEGKGIRKLAVGRYLILYRIEAEGVRILHVAHGARDYIRSLFPDD